MEVEYGRIISSRIVEIRGLQKTNSPGWGAPVGATIAGAAAYGISEADNPGGVAITIVALIGGAITGQYLDELRGSNLGAEYILQNENGEKFAVVQTIENIEEKIEPNNEVTLIYGKTGYLRVVPNQPFPVTDHN